MLSIACVGNYGVGDEEGKVWASSATKMRRSSYQHGQIKEGLSHLLSPKSGHNVIPQLKMTPPPCRYLLHIPHLHRRLLPPGRVEFTREHYFYYYGGYHMGDGRNWIKSTISMPSELLKPTIIRQSGGGGGGGGVGGGGGYSCSCICSSWLISKIFQDQTITIDDFKPYDLKTRCTA